MKKILTLVKLAATLTMVILTTGTAAAEPLSIADEVQLTLPNNTSTKLYSALTIDGILVPVAGYISQHLYGQEILLKVLIKDSDYHKEIYAVGNNKTQKVYFASSLSEFRMGGSKALYVGQDGGYAIVWLKISGHYLVSGAGTINPHHFTLYVKMGHAQYVLDSIKLTIN